MLVYIFFQKRGLRGGRSMGGVSRSHKENIEPAGRPVLQSRENISQPPNRRGRSLPVAPKGQLAKSKEKPKAREEHFRDSLEDGKLEDITVQDHTVVEEKTEVKNQFGATFVQGREMEETMTAKPQEREIPIETIGKLGETYVQGRQSMAPGKISGPFFDSCRESLSEQPIVTGNATFLNKTTDQLSELGSVLEAPALHSTVLAPTRPSEANVQSPGQKSSMMTKLKSHKPNWKALGHIETLTPIGKRQSQMHHFHDLGESIMEKEEIVYESIEQEIVERIEEEIIETTTTETWIEDGKGGKRLLKRDEKTETIAENVQEFQSTDYQSNMYKNLVADDPAFDALPGTPVRRTTFKKDDPTLPNTPVNRLTFQRDDLAFPETPIHRQTFIKDDPSLPDTPVHRMTFIKDDPNMPVTPVRRDTFLKRKSAMSNTPVINLETPPNLKTTSPRKTTPPDFDFQFDDASRPKVDKEQKKKKKSMRRSDTYTKLQKTPKPQSSGESSPRDIVLPVIEPQVDAKSPVESLAGSECYETPQTTPHGSPRGDDTPKQSPDESMFEKSVINSDSYTKEQGMSELLSQSINIQDFDGEDWPDMTKSKRVEDIREPPVEHELEVDEFKDTPLTPLNMKTGGKDDDAYLQYLISHYLKDDEENTQDVKSGESFLSFPVSL